MNRRLSYQAMVWGVSAALVCVIGIVLPPGGQLAAYAADSSYYNSDANSTSSGTGNSSSSEMSDTSGTRGSTSGTTGSASTRGTTGSYSTGGAAGSYSGRSTSSTDNTSAGSMQQMDVIRASKLKDAKVMGSQNEEIGKVHDVVLSPDMSTVSYVAVQRGGVLGMGERLYAVPWSAVTPSADGKSISVQISKKELESSKGFESKNWPEKGDAKWSKGASDYDTSRGYNSTTGAGSRSSTGSDMSGYNSNRPSTGSGTTGYGSASESGRSSTGSGTSSYGTTSESAKSSTGSDTSSYGTTSESARSSTGSDTSGYGSTGDSGRSSTGSDMSGTSSSNMGGEMAGRTSADTTTATGTNRYGTMDSNSKSTRWSDTDRDSKAMSADESIKMRRLSEIIKMDVKGRDNSSLGKLDDLGIDRTPGRVVFGIVSWGGMGKNSYSAVPWDMFVLQPKPRVAMIDIDKSALQAQTFEMSNWKSLSDRSFADKLYQQFGEEPYLQVYGYPKVDEQSTSTESWLAGSEYNKKFSASSIETVTGKIDSTGSFRPMSHAVSGLRLKITTSDGKNMTVHCGPRDYISQQGFTFKKGENVTVTGSQVQMGKNTVLIATSIQSGGKTLNLRDAQGNPMWTKDDLAKEMTTKGEKKVENEAPSSSTRSTGY